jgi:lysophospholipase L1-like esterase
MDLYKAAAALGFVGQGCGKSGQSADGLSDDMAAILASVHLPDVAIIAIGRNDSGGAPFRASYGEIIEALKTAGVPLILCRGVTPRADTSSVNGDIASVVADLADPSVVFIDTSGWIDIETVDEIHPTAAGYVTMGEYAAAAYAPYFAAATGSRRSLATAFLM